MGLLPSRCMEQWYCNASLCILIGLQCKQNDVVVFVLKHACASACDFCVTHTHHVPHTHSDTSSASAGDFCITHMNQVPHTHSDTSSASAGDFCITNKRCRQYFANKNTHVHEEPCSSSPNLSMGTHTHTHTHK